MFFETFTFNFSLKLFKPTNIKKNKKLTELLKFVSLNIAFKNFQKKKKQACNLQLAICNMQYATCNVQHL